MGSKAIALRSWKSANHIPEVVHIVLWKLKRPSGLTGPAAEEALSKAKAAIANLKNVPGPETVCFPLIMALMLMSSYNLDHL
jgi:hypothetical protein